MVLWDGDVLYKILKLIQRKEEGKEIGEGEKKKGKEEKKGHGYSKGKPDQNFHHKYNMANRGNDMNPSVT